MKQTFRAIAFTILAAALAVSFSFTGYGEDFWGQDYREAESGNIRSVNGKFYAYIVLLFNENPHFVNLIQKDSIPPKLMGTEGFHIAAYRSYLKTLSSTSLESLATTMLNIYTDPSAFSDARLDYFEGLLTRHGIVLKFARNANTGGTRISLDYCIYGRKSEVTVKHPLMETSDKIYNIRPFLYYDEFSTSNSTFYYDMIYISMDEVINDSIIASQIIAGKTVRTMFFVGSRITDDIKYCIQKAFTKKSNIKNEIWETFVIHELTHKMINNRYHYFDQVNGEELALMSTIYAKPYLGLAIMYSYLSYNSVNPHRIAAANFIKFVADKTGKKELVSKPELVKTLPPNEIRSIARDYFFTVEGKLSQMK